jgi:glycosyltransferase involved in cell wall biosynthesis
MQTFLFHANVLGGQAANRLGIPFSMGIRVADPRKWRSWIERRVSRNAGRVVCVSESVRAFVAGRGFDEKKLEVIENGVSPEAVAPIDREQIGVPSDATLLVCVGRLHQQKGLDWLVQHACSWIKDQRCHLLLVGDGPQASQLSASIRAQGLEGQVRLLGWRADAKAIIAASDLLILPSRWEGMPNVVMEAMGLGKAVLCGEAEGVRDLLGEAADAQTAPFGDANRWSKRLLSLANDADTRHELGEANSARILKHFSRSVMVGRFESLFERLASEA